MARQILCRKINEERKVRRRDETREGRGERGEGRGEVREDKVRGTYKGEYNKALVWVLPPRCSQVVQQMAYFGSI